MTDAPAKAGERGKPILFSAPMVKALIAGTKTQTRRIIKPQPPETARYSGIHYASGEPDSHFFNTPHGGFKVRQRIAEGDRLWVREAVRGEELECGQDGVRYRADDAFAPIANTARASIDWLALHTYWGHSGTPVGPWAPGIHMPRWASRLTLIVTDVRVQRLQDISEEDAVAEGFGGDFPDRVMPDVFPPRGGNGWGDLSIAQCYGHLWDHINGAGSWAANPWVAAYSFEVHHQNIDAMPLPAARDAAKEVG